MQTPDLLQPPSTRNTCPALVDYDTPSCTYDAGRREGSTTNLTMCPTRGVADADGCDGTVTRVNSPPPLPPQEDSQVMIPHPPHRHPYIQRNWGRKPPILFSTWGHPGVKLLDALGEKFEGIDGRDDYPFDTNSGITIRIHFPGYPSSTDVEKTLKQWAEMGKRSKARSMRLSTVDYKVQRRPIPKSKLAQELSKRIRWHIQDLECNSDLFPFNHQVDERWRLGQGKMKFEYMLITGLDNVSSGSWAPTICVEQFPDNNGFPS